MTAKEAMRIRENVTAKDVDNSYKNKTMSILWW